MKVAHVRPDFRRCWAYGSPDFGVDQRMWLMRRFGSCYYTRPVIRAGRSVGDADGGVGAGCEVEVAGRFGQVERGEDGLLVAGQGRALRDAAVGGGEGDRVHAVEFVAQVAPGVAGSGFGDPDEQQCQPT